MTQLSKNQTYLNMLFLLDITYIIFTVQKQLLKM